jgi:O-antigen ligase
MIYVLLADIPKVGVFPVSPRFFFMAASLFLLWTHRRQRLIYSLKEMPVTLILFLVLLFIVGIIKMSLRMIVSCLEGIGIFIVVFYMVTRRISIALRTIRLLAFFYIASSIWLMMSIFIPEPFSIVRDYLYSSHLDRFEFGELELARPTGFTFNHFNMGYQLSVGMMLTLLLSYFEKGRWKILWLAGSFVCAGAIILAAQRSAVLGVAVASIIFLLHQRAKSLMALIAILFLASFYLLQSTIVPIMELETISSKIEKEEDYRTRLLWQIAALRIISERPGGSIFSDMDWEKEAQIRGADFDYYGGDVKFVHNAYLGNALNYGWLGAVLVLMTLWYIYRRMLRGVLSDTYHASALHPYALICVLAMVSVMIQALFHNSNLFTIEPSTWVIFSVSSGLMWMLRREKQS